MGGGGKVERGRRAWVLGGWLLASGAAFVAACVSDAPSGTDGPDASDDDGGTLDAADDASDATADAPDDATADVTADSATSDASDAGDAADAAPACDPLKPFGARQAIPGLPGDAVGVRLYDAQRTAYFFRTSTSTLWMATRLSSSGTFSGIAAVPIMAPEAGVDVYPTLDDKELALYFGSSRGGTFRLWGSVRTNTAFSFPDPGVLANVNADVSGRPSVTGDGEELFYQTTPSDGSSNTDIVEAHKNAGGGFDPPIGVLTDPSFSDITPAVTPDGLTLYFSSRRINEPKQKLLTDVWVTRRATRGSAFGTPTIEDSASTDDYDFPTWGSDDGCVLYVSSQSTSAVMVRPL